MAIIGKIIAQSIRLNERLSKQSIAGLEAQKEVLKSLLDRAQYTVFGRQNNFSELLHSPDIIQKFAEKVPINDYYSMWSEWWQKLHEGYENVTWPGKISYFALSSGTTGQPSKHIPVTKEMIKSTQKVARHQMWALRNFGVSDSCFEKGVLMLGGSTHLEDYGEYWAGDMSGISAKAMPKWLSYLYYKPGRHISNTVDWDKRIKMMVKKAPKWDVGILAGIPSWGQILLQEIIKEYQLSNIHDIWPNFELYMHGGVSMEPYRNTFQKLLGRPIKYMETYMASEGSFGFQAYQNEDMRLILNAGIYFEFVPMDSQNFIDGNLVDEPKVLNLSEVKEGEPYALLISTVAGAWRYLIGDVIKFTDLTSFQFQIQGRTRQFMNVCGEHLSIENMNEAIKYAQNQLDLDIPEFILTAVATAKSFKHCWYIGCDDLIVQPKEIAKEIDSHLKKINEDYRVERDFALEEVEVVKLKPAVFLEYLKHQGKYGAMNKVPRTLKGEEQHKWEAFLLSKNV